MNTISTKCSLDSLLQLRVTDNSNHSCFIEKPNIECSVNFIQRHIFKQLIKEETLLQTSLSYSSLKRTVDASTVLRMQSAEKGTPMNQPPQSSPHLSLCHSYCFGTLKDTIYIKISTVSSNVFQEGLY